jgi:tetratricopeptide (TPR) repeat protein
MLQTGKIDEAIPVLQRAVAVQRTPEALINLAAAHSMKRQWPEAAQVLETALELNPKEYKTWESLAKVYARLPGQSDRSRDAFLKAEQLARELQPSRAGDAALHADIAAYLAFTGRRREALERLQRALALEPGNVGVMITAAEAYDYLGFRTEALNWVKEALDHGFPVREVELSHGLEELRKDTRYTKLAASRSRARAR